MRSSRSGRAARVAAAALTAALSTACTNEAKVAVDDSELELYSYWTADTDANDFADTVKIITTEFTRQNPDVLVRNGSVNWIGSASGDYWTTVIGRIDEDLAPDVYQVGAISRIRANIVDGHIAPLPDFATDFVLSADDVEMDGKPFGVPMNVIRDNVIYVNLNVFRAAGITDEEVAKLKSKDATYQDLFAIADKIGAYYQAEDIAGTPFGIYHSATDDTSDTSAIKYPWAYKDVFLDCILPGTLGASNWKSLLEEPSSEKWRDPAISEALLNLKHYVDRSNQDFMSSAPEAAPWNTLLEGKSAMVMLGDWYVSTLRQSELVWGKDWDAFACPGTGDSFIGHSDTWVMPPNAPHPENALKFLEIASSKEVQLAFNAKFGALPAAKVTEADLSDANGFDGYARASYKKLEQVGFKWRTEAVAPDTFSFLDVLGPFADKVIGVDMEAEAPVVDAAIAEALEGFVGRCIETSTCK